APGRRLEVPLCGGLHAAARRAGGRAGRRRELVVSDPDAYYPGPAGRTHPGPASARLPQAIREAIIDHARAAVPNEACGIIVGNRPAGEGGTASGWVPLRNPLASPYRYAIDP